MFCNPDTNPTPTRHQHETSPVADDEISTDLHSRATPAPTSPTTAARVTPYHHHGREHDPRHLYDMRDARRGHRRASFSQSRTSHDSACPATARDGQPIFVDGLLTRPSWHGAQGDAQGAGALPPDVSVSLSSPRNRSKLDPTHFYLVFRHRRISPAVVSRASLIALSALFCLDSAPDRAPLGSCSSRTPRSATHLPLGQPTAGGRKIISPPSDPVFLLHLQNVSCTPCSRQWEACPRSPHHPTVRDATNSGEGGGYVILRNLRG